MPVWSIIAIVVAVLMAGSGILLALWANAAADRALSRLNAIENDELTPAPRGDWRKKVL
jgi:hypothetical protein